MRASVVLARSVRTAGSAAPMRAAVRPAVVSAASSSSPLPPSANVTGAAQTSIAGRRAFFSLPDISKLAGLVPGDSKTGIANDGEEQRFQARKVFPYTPAQLYELVSDVPAYVTFIPFCTESTVLHADGRPNNNWKPGQAPFQVEAELAVGFGGLEERYISNVVGVPFEKVSATASKTTPLFKNLVTTWSFTPAGPTSTILSIDLVFAFANPLHRIASQAVLPKVAEKMVEAFETRANEVYGGRR